MYATCQQLQAQAQAHITEFRLHVPPSIGFSTRGRLQSLRLQLALLDREFDDLDYDALRALDADNSHDAPSMSEEEINALPIHKYKGQPHGEQSGGSSQQQASSSSSSAAAERIKQDDGRAGGSAGSQEDELTCSVCLEQVNAGELVRSLPCLHQFHTGCIDPWLRQQGTCPVCKHRASSGWRGNDDDQADASFMV
ncbi:E3 ubiquitin-protein ligase SDIR1-like [Asparagus officinalis]|nr:E3 ubiquitin-protein ligase SDIR1-like [Asparagus officinalis]